MSRLARARRALYDFANPEIETAPIKLETRRGQSNR